MKKNAKISSAAYRVLLIKRLLKKEDLSIDEILTVFAADVRISRSFTKEVALKYIHTLKVIGVEICKRENEYSIKKSFVKYDLTLENIKTLAMIDAYVSNLHQGKIINLYQSFLAKLKKFLPDDQIALLESEISKQCQLKKFNFNSFEQYSDLIKQYEKCCIEDLRVKILYKLPVDDSVKSLVLEPKSVKYTFNNIYLSGYNPNEGEKQLLLINYVQEITQLPQKSRHSDITSTVVFKLKGRLVKGYRLYDGEKVLESDEENSEIIVSNSNEDKTALFKRLLRYGDLCEILQPKSERDRFVNIIREALKNYV